MPRQPYLISKTAVAKWTADELKLIGLIKKHPELYSCSFKKDPIVDTLWDTVAVGMGVPAEKCRLRWHNLRKTYFRCNHNAPKNRSKLLDGTLSFIDPTIKRRKPRKKLKKPMKAREEKVLLIEEVESSDITSQPLSDPLNLSDEVMPVDMKPVANKIPKPVPLAPAPIGKPQQASSSSSTVLTQDIIEYLIKSKNDERNTEDDIFQSMANLVSENPKETPSDTAFTETPQNLLSPVSNINDSMKPQINHIQPNVIIFLQPQIHKNTSHQNRFIEEDSKSEINTQSNVDIDASDADHVVDSEDIKPQTNTLELNTDDSTSEVSLKIEGDDDIKVQINLQPNIGKDTLDSDIINYNGEIEPQLNIVRPIIETVTSDAYLVNEPQKDIKVEIDFEDDEDLDAFYV